MGLAKVWTCDHCGHQEVIDPVRELIERGEGGIDRPPAGWQVIRFPGNASDTLVLLCPACTSTMYETFIQGRSQSETGASKC